MSTVEHHPLTDAQWASIRDQLFMDPADPRMPTARRRVDQILWAFHAGRSDPSDMTFSELADLGDRFIAGVDGMCAWHAHLAGLRAEGSGTEPLPSLTFSDVERAAIQRFIDNARIFQADVDGAGQHGLIMPETRSKNDRPWQREAVTRLERLWNEVRGDQKRGDKKRLVAFAAAALAPLKENVTEGAISTMLRPGRQKR